MSSHAMVTPRRTGREQVAASQPGGGSRAAQGVRASGGALGGEPRVSLLPAEVNDFHRARAVRRRLGVGVFAVLALVAVAVGGAAYLSFAAQAELDAARLASQDLITQQAEYAELRNVQGGIALAQAGQKVGASTEIDWTEYLVNLQATLPDGVTINTVAIDSASPFEDYGQSTVPLQGTRVATLSFAATSPTLPSIPEWLDGLATLVGFTDAVPDSVVLQDGGYLVNITMHINADAYSQRFAGESK